MKTTERLDIRPIPESDKTWIERSLGVGVRMAWWLVLVLVVMCATYYYQTPVPQPTELVEKLNTLKQEQAALEKKRDAQARRVNWLKNEPDYLAIEARDQLNMKQEGETVLRLEPER